jgi:hypothetical protein
MATSKNNKGRIIFKRLSSPSTESPRCILKIPEKVQSNLLHVPNSSFPSIHKPFSSNNSPLPLSPRIIKDKDYEFPDIFKAQSPEDVNGYAGETQINSHDLRKIKKYNSHKNIKKNSLGIICMTKSSSINNLDQEINTEYFYIINN